MLRLIFETLRKRLKGANRKSGACKILFLAVAKYFYLHRNTATCLRSMFLCYFKGNFKFNMLFYSIPRIFN